MLAGHSEMEMMGLMLELIAALLHGDDPQVLVALAPEMRRCASCVRSAKSRRMPIEGGIDFSATVCDRLPIVAPLFRPNRESRSAEKLRARILPNCE